MNKIIQLDVEIEANEVGPMKIVALIDTAVERPSSTPLVTMRNSPLPVKLFQTRIKYIEYSFLLIDFIN